MSNHDNDTADRVQPPAEEYESPFPECKVAATMDPHGIVRLDMSRKRLGYHADQYRQTLNEWSGEPIPVMMVLPNRAYKHMADNLGRLVSTDAEAIQVVTDEEPDYSVSVLLNKGQIEGLERDFNRDYNRNPNNTAYGWRLELGRTVLELAVDQFIAAVNGADDPVAAVDDRE